uniref:Protein bicaudal D n=1 Tax=Aceria tosichella TaxID=561515 RepID=A0A6G1SRG2_9ACAR
MQQEQQRQSGQEQHENIERLSRELAAAQQERSQSAAYGLKLLNEKEDLQRKYESIEALYEQSKQELQELREAWNKAVNEQRVSATTVFEKEVQLLNDSDALQASFTHAKQEIERELKQTKSQLDSAISEKERYAIERDDLAKKVSALEQERKALKIELKDLQGRETRLFNENSELEEENVSLQKQVSNLRSTQVEFESSKHEIQRLQDEVVGLNSQLEEMVTLKRITERQMQEALEALQSEREQKYALRKELDKRNTADPLINWTSLAALKGSPHLANLALRGFGSSPRDHPSREGGDVSPNGFGSDQDGATTYSEQDPSYDMIHDLEMPSIEGSLFDEVHLTEIKKLQQNLEEKENQRSNLNTKLIELQHKLESKIRQADEIETKLTRICTLVEEFYNESDANKSTSPAKQKLDKQQVAIDNNGSRPTDEEPSSTTNEYISPNQLSQTASATSKSNILDDFDNIYSHLQAIYTEFKSYQEISALNRSNKQISDAAHAQAPDQSLNVSLSDQSITEGGGDKRVEAPETLHSDDVPSLRAMLFKKHEQLKQLRTILKSNKESAEVALKNLKSKYDMEKAIVAETMTKLRLEHKRLNEDAATFASLRSHFSARIEEYNTEIEKLQSKLAASEQEKSTLNSILRMAIEQKVMLTQKLEALEMERENNQDNNNKGGQHPRSGMVRGRGSASGGGRNTRSSRVIRNSDQRQR